jgi:hypothetical protein
MASQEHLQLLDNGDSTSTSSSEEDDSTSSEDGDDRDDGDDAQDSVDPATRTSVVASESSSDSSSSSSSDDDGSSSSSSSDNDDADSLDGELTRVSAGPKNRIKLVLGNLKTPGNLSKMDIKTSSKSKLTPSSLTGKKSSPKGLTAVPTKKAKFGKTLPTKKNRTFVGGSSRKTEKGDDVKAMIVDSDDGGDDDAVAAIVEDVASSKDAAPKRRPANPVRPIRLPSMSSPGLLMPPASGIYRGSTDANGFTTPASVFDHAMSLAGYTTEGRAIKPHRGSSVQRVVGDMFDSNIRFSLHFPKLVPDLSLKKGASENGKHEENERSENEDHGETLIQRLIKALDSTAHKPAKAPSEAGACSEPSKKKRKLLGFSDMVPLSLTLPYPEQYIQKRLEYVKLVDER